MRLTTVEMAKISGVAYRTLQDIEQERSEGGVQTMNRLRSGVASPSLHPPVLLLPQPPLVHHVQFVALLHR